MSSQNWSLNHMQKLRHFSKSEGCNSCSVRIQYGCIPFPCKAQQTVLWVWLFYWLRTLINVPGSSLIRSHICPFSFIVRAGGCSALGKLDGMYFVWNLLMILYGWVCCQYCYVWKFLLEPDCNGCVGRRTNFQWDFELLFLKYKIIFTKF